ncbi:MAG: SRPBCC domain-containing protein [Bacteroidota bacterium]|nr:SRPBCC domain-containing protein [Bacteroidota bacterium]
MATPGFTTTFFVNQTPTEVFNAVNNVRGWWQGEIEGRTDNVGDEFTYRMKDFHFSKQKLIDVVPDKKIVWLVTDSKLNFLTNKNEWTGTTISFEITEINNKTQLRFKHHGLVPNIECYGSCSTGWSKLIQESLLSLVTTGKGKNVF